MTKRFLISSMFGCFAAVVMAATPLGSNGGSPQKGVKLSPKQIETIRAVQPWLGASSQNSKPKSTAPRVAPISSKKDFFRSPDKVNSSGSTIQGWRSTDEWSGIPKGWYEVNLDGSQTFRWDYHDPDWVDDGWSDEPDFPFTTGFYRNGKVYGFHAEMILYWLVWGHGSFTLDGEIEDYQQYGDYFDVTDFSTYVMTCAYDSDQDIVYAYTLNEDASGYMLQSVDADTWAFTEIRRDVPIKDVLIGFAYNPVDKKLYGLTPDSRFVTLDPTSGELSQVAKFSLPVTTSTEGMTYSPFDKAFVLVVPSENVTCDIYTINPENPELVKCATLQDSYQYRILVTPDVIVEGATPLTAEIQSVEFVNGSSDGKALVTLPAKTFDGSNLSGGLELVVSVDGTEHCVVSGTPGETVEVMLTGIAEGIRRFSFVVRGNNLESAAVQQSLYVGFDIPVAPQNIELQSGVLTWDSVTATINGGYLDEANLTYNIYLNGEKINQNPVKECEFAFTMPEAVYQKYVAQVEAENHGHVSERGFSNDIKEGHAFPLPFSMAPTRAEAELVKVESERHQMLTWRGQFDDWSGESSFVCQTLSYDSDGKEWLFLPAIEVPAMDHLLEISFDVMRYSYNDDAGESIGVGISSTQDSSNAEIVNKWDDITENDWVRLTAYCFPHSGDNYIGFFTKLHSDGYYLYVRNICVKESELPTITPAAVSELRAEALPQGELKAKVSFTMPTLDASGKELSDAKLTAVIRSEAGMTTVSGAPGEEVVAEVATVEGFNTITVVAVNSADGLEASTKVFTGTDVPTAVSVSTASHTADYKGMHIEWEDPIEGANGGYVNPDDITYALYFYNEEEYEWQVVKELGNVNSCDISVDVPTGIEIVEVGLLAQNTKGNCGTLRVIGCAVGNPYSLPMYETFGHYDHSYGPMVGELPSEEYTNGWGFCESYPYWLEKPSPYGTASYIMHSYDGEKGRVVLPAFSTENVSAAGIELPLYAVKGKNEIRVLARAYGIEPQLLGMYEGTSEPTWAKCRFHLPSEFIGKKWVEILIDGEFVSEEESNVSFGQYKIQTFVAEDVAVTSVNTPAFAFIGENVEIIATVENQGQNTVNSPEVEVVLTRGERELGVLPMERTTGSGPLDELAEATYKAVWTPDAEGCGEISATVRLAGTDMQPDNDTMVAHVIIGRGKSAIVTDLAGNITEDCVALTWTDPDIETGFESFEGQISYYYGDNIGAFKTICCDEYESLYFIFNFPYGRERKAWQVMSEEDATERMAEEGWDNTLFKAASGDKFLMAVSPLSFFVGEDLEADRWLISPEVKGGSDFSFMLGAFSGRVEPFEVLYSSTDDDPDSFILIEAHTVLSDQWKKYEYTLPEDAKYFAIRYIGISSNHVYILVDDISYEPIKAVSELVGYDIYRDGVMIAENVNIRGSYVDSYIPEDVCTYNVVPVVRHDGELTRGLTSNTAFVGLSGVAEIEEGIDANAEYYTLQGIRVQTPQNGIYIKKIGNKVGKVMLK